MIKGTKTVCFTGKRPQSMPWGFDEDDKHCIKLKERLQNEVEKSILDGYTNFICGMALGVDTYAADIVIKLKEKYPQITLEAALPCESQFLKWKEKDKVRYLNLLNLCDKIVFVGRKYTSSCMLIRNRYMVDNSDLLIAVYNGTGGGTENTIKYAKNRNIKVNIIEF